MPDELPVAGEIGRCKSDNEIEHAYAVVAIRQSFSSTTIEGNLQGSTLGKVAFQILQVIPFGENGALRGVPVLEQANDPQEIAKVVIKILDADRVCVGATVYDAPGIIDEDTSAPGHASEPEPLDTGFGKFPTPEFFP